MRNCHPLCKTSANRSQTPWRPMPQPSWIAVWHSACWEFTYVTIFRHLKKCFVCALPHHNGCFWTRRGMGAPSVDALKPSRRVDGICSATDMLPLTSRRACCSGRASPAVPTALRVRMSWGHDACLSGQGNFSVCWFFAKRFYSDEQVLSSRRRSGTLKSVTEGVTKVGVHHQSLPEPP